MTPRFRRPPAETSPQSPYGNNRKSRSEATEEHARSEKRERGSDRRKPSSAKGAHHKKDRRRRESESVNESARLARTDGPVIVVSRRGATRLRSGNPWVYQSDVVAADGVGAGVAVPVFDERGKQLGTALYSNASQIAVRMISRDKLEDGGELLDLVRERVASAIDYRTRVVSDSDACRLIFSEADFLPGLIVDRYNDVLSLQVLTQAMDRADIRAVVLDELVKRLKPAGVVERVEARIRELEELPRLEGGLVHGDKAATTFTMNGMKFQFDGMAGQKTGAFLDQRENYAAAAKYARGEALDVFCYQGGFALHMARVCEHVTGVDASRTALEVADQNAGANADSLLCREIEWIEANAFDLLRDYADAGRHYDTIVLDPPGFAKSKKALDTALRGYKELNLRALKMLPRGGLLVTCSCSFHVSETEFLQMLSEAAADAHRSLRIVEKRMQAKDHPVLLQLPETHYLKCIIAEVE